MGYNYTGSSLAASIPRQPTAPEEIDKLKKGNATSIMFLKAMELSSSGPWGCMNLEEGDEKGTAAFLRGLDNFIQVQDPPDDEDYIELEEYQTIQPKLSQFQGQLIMNTTQNEESGYMVCKEAISPLILFLHLDQGSFEKRGYTPFASPLANSRSVHRQYVDQLCYEVFTNHKDILSHEDYAVVGYSLIIDEVKHEEESCMSSEVGHEEESSNSSEDLSNSDEEDKGKNDKESSDSNEEDDDEEKDSDEEKDDDEEKDNKEDIAVGESEEKINDQSTSHNNIPKKGNGMKYRCILNRDQRSHETIDGKGVVPLVRQHLLAPIKRVSYGVSLFFVCSNHQAKPVFLSNKKCCPFGAIDDWSSCTFQR